MNTKLARIVTPLALAAATIVPAVPAAAQPAPPPPPPNGPPPYGAPPYGVAYAHQLRGTVATFSAYRLLLADGPGGRTTQVDLSNSTRIFPVGTTLTPGMHVQVLGHWSNGTFIARRISLI